MKLFTKEINNKLFKQYPFGNDLERQVAVAKIFNPYGRGRWYLLNSDPEDPDYLWAIVEMGGEVEIGSVSRSELESIRVRPFMLPFERDLGFRSINAKELYDGLRQGKFYKKGGMVEDENLRMILNQKENIEHHADELEEAARKSDHIPAWVLTKTQRASTDLADVTHYLEGENEITEEEIDDFDLGGMMADGGLNAAFQKMMDKVTNYDVVVQGQTQKQSTGWMGSNILSINVKAENEKEAEKIGKAQFLIKYPNDKIKRVSVSPDLSASIPALQGNYADGGMMANGGIGFIPMDLEEKLRIIAKWGGIDVKGVIGLLNAMIDSGVTDEDLKAEPTKNTAFQRERAVEKKVQEIWAKIEPKYQGGLKGNQYYSTIKELVKRNEIYGDILNSYKPYRKYQNQYADGGMMAKGGVIDKKNIEIRYLSGSGESYIRSVYDLDGNTLYASYSKSSSVIGRDDVEDLEDEYYHIIHSNNHNSRIGYGKIIVKNGKVVEDDFELNYADGGVTSSPNIKFMEWYAGWLKDVKDYISVAISIPNEFSSPIKDDNGEIVILDVIEKKGDSDAKKYMNEILKKADELGVSIYLQPIPRTHNLKSQEHKNKITKDYLINYYEKFGFKNMDGGFMVREPKMADGGTMAKGGGFIDFRTDIPQEWQLVEWSLNGHSPSFKGQMYFQKGTGFLFIQKENGEIYEPKPSNKLFWRPIKVMAKGGMMAEGGETDLIKKFNEKIKIDRGDVDYAEIRGLIKSVKNENENKKGFKEVKHIPTINALNLGKKLGLFIEVEDKRKPFEKRGFWLKEFKTEFASGGTMAKGGKIKVGNRFGDWAITQYYPIVYEERGGTRDGIIKLVNQDTFDEILIKYDGYLRSPKWYARNKGVQVEGKSPKEVIEKLKLESFKKGGKVKFKDKVAAIKASLLERKKVSPKVQKDYGETYSPKEAEESEKRIVGAMTAKERLLAKRKKAKK